MENGKWQLWVVASSWIYGHRFLPCGKCQLLDVTSLFKIKSQFGWLSLWMRSFVLSIHFMKNSILHFISSSCISFFGKNVNYITNKPLCLPLLFSLNFAKDFWHISKFRYIVGKQMKKRSTIFRPYVSEKLFEKPFLALILTIKINSNKNTCLYLQE